MRYITDDRGLLNNFAAEPTVYFAEYPSSQKQRQYVLQGAVATVVVALTILTAIAVS
jgi:hypothetical protein